MRRYELTIPNLLAAAQQIENDIDYAGTVPGIIATAYLTLAKGAEQLQDIIEALKEQKERQKKFMVDVVYFDNECQCELWRGTPEEMKKFDENGADMLGGGNYNYYDCPQGYKIVKVEGRAEGKPLRITIEEDIAPKEGANTPN